MSQVNTYTIGCPQCRQVQAVELYQSINLETDPELRAALLGNQLNAVTCQACGFRFIVDGPLLYNDRHNGFMVYWLPLNGRTVDEGQQEFRQYIEIMHKMMPEQPDPPTLHLVFTRSELVEKIFLLEENLDERVIEYVKYTMYTKNIERVDPRTKVLLFDAEDSTPERLVFVVQDAATRKLECALEYQRAAYASLVEMFDHDDQTANLLELFPGPYVSARELLLKELKGEE